MKNRNYPGNAPPQESVGSASSLSSAATPVEDCASCGRPLVRRGLKGECLRCLMDFAFPVVGDEPPPEISAPVERSQKSVLRYGHFEVDTDPDGHPVELGAGAMATTYRARDSVLHSTVALKVINQTVAEHPSARARFLREARAAAKLHHPNVASVSHYGEQDGECYYVMELVEGETLEARVRREGPLLPEFVLDIGIQVGRALAVAEACGVMHRDLKPSNLMLAAHQGEGPESASTIVKVIDWGLAKALSAESPLGTDHTRGGFVGTPAFASPEQFSREDERRIDTRSDIYSLGVTLWYLLCGRTPFGGTTLEEIHSRQIGQSLPLEQLSAKRVPDPIVALLKSMLAVDPSARPQSARELIEALHGCLERSWLEPTMPPIPRSRSRWGAETVVMATLLMVAVVGWLFYHRAPVVPSERSVAVLPFENLSPEAADAFFTAGVQDQIAADLAHVASLKVVGSDSTRLYPPKDRDLPRIGQELGVAYLLEGSVRRTEGRVEVSALLINARESTHAWAKQYNRQLNEVFTVQSEITHAVAAWLQAPLTPGESAAVNELPTNDLVAYDFYLRAHEGATLVADEAAQRQQERGKIALLEKAVARDPDFFLAYCALATAHDTLYLHRAGATTEELSVDHQAIAESILATARRLRPDAGELHLAQAYHFAHAPTTYEQAHIELDLARRSLPNDAGVEDVGAQIARAQGRWEDAIHCLERAVVLEPRDYGTLYDLAGLHLLMRRYGDYKRNMAKLIDLMPVRARVSLPLEITLGPLEGKGDTAPLRAALATFAVSDETAERKKDLFSILLSLSEHDADALSRVLAASKQTQFLVSGVPHPKPWYEALAARMRGDEAGARTAFAAARLETEKSVLANPRSAKLLSLLAMIDAGLGRNEAVDEAQRACAMVSHSTASPVIGCNLAVVHAWLGQPDAAFAELERWVDRPAGNNLPSRPTYGDFRLNPIWDALRSDPRFEVLVNRMAPPSSADVPAKP
ncbi:MAG: protein kinase [Rhodospirillales bacterium]|nr:protein kinase [Acetobacter sp.]